MYKENYIKIKISTFHEHEQIMRFTEDTSDTYRTTRCEITRTNRKYLVVSCVSPFTTTTHNHIINQLRDL